MPVKFKGTALVHPSRKGDGDVRRDARLGKAELESYANVLSKDRLAICDNHDWSRKFGETYDAWVDEDGVKTHFEIPIVDEESQKLVLDIMEKRKAGISGGQLPPFKYGDAIERCETIYPFEVSLCEEGQMETARVLTATLVDGSDRVIASRILASKTVNSVYEDRERMRHTIASLRFGAPAPAPIVASTSTMATPDAAPPAGAPAAGAPAPTSTTAPTTTPTTVPTTTTAPATDASAAAAAAATAAAAPMYNIDPALLQQMIPAGMDPNKFFVEMFANNARLTQEEEKRIQEDKARKRVEHEKVIAEMYEQFAHLRPEAGRIQDQGVVASVQRNFDNLDRISAKLKTGLDLTVDESIDLMRSQTDLGVVASRVPRPVDDQPKHGFNSYNAGLAQANFQTTQYNYWDQVAPEVRNLFAQATARGAPPNEAAAYTIAKSTGAAASTMPPVAASAPAAVAHPNAHGGVDVVVDNAAAVAARTLPSASAAAAVPVGASASLGQQTTQPIAASEMDAGRAPRFEFERRDGGYRTADTAPVPIGASKNVLMRAGIFTQEQLARAPKFNGAIVASRGYNNGGRLPPTALLPNDPLAVSRIAPAVKEFCATAPIAAGGYYSSINHPAYQLFVAQMAAQYGPLPDTIRRLPVQASEDWSQNMSERARQGWVQAHRRKYGDGGNRTQQLLHRDGADDAADEAGATRAERQTALTIGRANDNMPGTLPCEYKDPCMMERAMMAY